MTNNTDAFNTMLTMYPVEKLESLVRDNDDFDIIHDALVTWMSTVPGITFIKANAMAYLAQVIYRMGYDYHAKNEQLKEIWGED